jgi:hypothetical protein
LLGTGCMNPIVRTYFELLTIHVLLTLFDIVVLNSLGK